MNSWIPKRLKALVRAKAMQMLGLNHTLTSGRRIQLRSFSEWCIYNDIFVDGEYDKAIAWAVERMNQADEFVAVDLGANRGYFAIRCEDRLGYLQRSLKSGVIYMVEASAPLVRLLKEEFSRGDRLMQFRIQHGLVGKREGTAKFHLASEHVASSVNSATGEAGCAMHYFDIAIWLREVHRIDLLKCDIEGSEYDLLEAFPDVLAKAPVAIFEFHGEQSRIEAGIATMRRAGYARCEHIRSGQDCATMLFAREG